MILKRYLLLHTLLLTLFSIMHTIKYLPFKKISDSLNDFNRTLRNFNFLTISITKLFVLLVVSGLVTTNAVAQLPGYDFKKKITIHNTQVSGITDLTNFPVLISHIDADLKTTGNGGNVTNPNGYDIVFTASDGTTLLVFEMDNHEATTGEYIAWVIVPTVDYNDDTEIYIHYGNSSVSTNQSSASTWGSNYLGVWHMDDDPDGDVANSVKDATSNNNHGTPDGNMTSADLVPGKIGLAIDFDGTATVNEADIIITKDIDKLSNVITYSAWIWNTTPHEGSSDAGLIMSKNKTNSDTPYCLTMNKNNYAKTIIHNATANGNPIALNDTVWHYIVGRSDGTTLTLFVDGDSISSSTPGTWADNNESMAIGGSEDTPKYRPFKGKIDEARISNTAHSSDWIKTEYNSQNSPPTFYSMGVEELSTPLPVELVQFEATCQNETPTLTWTTASEINNDYFTIERSIDAVNFEPVSIVNGNGNSSTAIHYNWTDENPINGTVYYRLKQTDFNGVFEYHGVRTITCEQTNDIRIFPNPFKNNLTIQLSENTNYPKRVEVLNYLGKIVHAKIIENGVTTLVLEKYSAGTYFIKVSTKTTQVVERIIKRK
ncbi:MAG: hypothetical protein COB15_06555 [Flavobacteriales bacterium]|nr:MAG: hypothetical protein COB15_06555 [Flavobacteriales bacterium]